MYNLWLAKVITKTKLKSSIILGFRALLAVGGQLGGVIVILFFYSSFRRNFLIYNLIRE